MKNILFILFVVSLLFSACSADSKKYIIEDSDVVEISKSVIERMSNHELWIARNEIYARKGRKFTNTFLESYFYNCEWYNPKIEPADFDENLLSDVEKRNVELLYSEQKKRDRQKKCPIKCEFNKEYSIDLDGDGVNERISVTYKQGEWGAEDIQIHINEKHYDADSGILSLNERGYYITDIAHNKPGLEIALMDYGPSSDLVTHFYVYSEEDVQYVGEVGDFPFEEYIKIDAFGQDNTVIAINRTDVIETTFSYAYWIYDFEAKKISLRKDLMYNVAPIREKTLKKPIYVYTEMNVYSSKKYLKPQKLYFLASDGNDWTKIKCEDNSICYIYSPHGKIEGTDEEKYEIYEPYIIYD